MAGENMNASNRGKTSLMMASQEGNIHTVETLIKNGTDIDATDIVDRTAAMFSCISGHKEVLQLLLDKGNIDVNKRDNRGKTMLMYCCERGHFDLVQLLIGYGADINICDKRQRTSLTLASQSGHSVIVAALIKQNVEMQSIDKYQRTAFLTACENGHEKVAELLLNSGAIIDKVDGFGKSALMHACSKGYYHLVELLVKHEKNIDQMDKKGKTALMYSSLHGYNDIIDLLIKHGASVNIMDRKWGQTALICACKEKKVDTMKLLLNYGADINMRLVNTNIDLIDFLPYDGRNYQELRKGALIYACKRNSVSAAKLLMSNGADLNNLNGAFVHAFCEFRHKIVKLLIDNGVEWKGLLERIPHLKEYLLRACYQGKYEFIELMSNYGVDMSIKNASSEDALLMACSGGHKKLVQFLLNHGLSIHDSKDASESTPLMRAIMDGHEHLIEFLLENGDDIAATDIFGRTPLMLVCGKSKDFVNKSVSIFKTLIRYGANLHSTDLAHVSVLIHACQTPGLETIVETTLQHNVNVNAKDLDGQTALMCASKIGNKKVIELLLKYGAEVNCIDIRGCNALTYAMPHEDVFNMLINHGAVDADPHNELGSSLLWLATVYGSMEKVKILRSLGGDINMTDQSMTTLLMLACAYSHYPIVDYLIKAGLDVNQRDLQGRTALIHMVYTHRYDSDESVMELLLKSGASVNLVDQYGKTALMYSCETCHSLKKVELLLLNGANINDQSTHGKTALIYASESHQSKKVELLIQHKANVAVQCSSGKSALMYTALIAYGDECMKLLLKSGADTELKCLNGLTVVTYAILRPSIKGLGLEILVKGGKVTTNGRLNAIHRVGKSRFSVGDLMLATKCKIFEWELCSQKNLIKFSRHALEAGICPGRTSQNDKNTSPLVAACLGNDPKMVQLILDILYFYPEDYKTVWEKRNELVTMERYLDRILVRPLSLFAWSFLTISKAISFSGSPCGRRSRIEQLPLPLVLKTKLKFNVL